MKIIKQPVTVEDNYTSAIYKPWHTTVRYQGRGYILFPIRYPNIDVQVDYNPPPPCTFKSGHTVGERGGGCNQLVHLCWGIENAGVHT